MPLGDSITQANHDHNSYRRPLWHKLGAAGYSVDFVGSENRHHGGGPPHRDFDWDHEGHWGWRADEILEHIGEWAQTYEPDVALIHLGTNDVFQRQSIRSTIDELGQIIDRLRRAKPQVKILLAQIIPVDDPAKNDRILELNKAILALGRQKHEELSPVMVVDQYTDLDPRNDTYDGVHPNSSGEEKMAGRWFSALDGLIATR